MNYTQLLNSYQLSINYSTCNRVSSLTSSPSFLSTTAKIIATISVPSNFFTIFVIKFQTPKTMREIKYCLLHMKICLLMTLYFFAPTYVFFPIGFLNFFNFTAAQQFSIGMMAFGGIGCSGVMLFENRHHCLMPKGTFLRINNPIYRVLQTLLNFSSGLFMALFAVINSSNNDKQKYDLLKHFPCPHPLYFDPRSFSLEADTANIVLSFFILSFVLCCQLLFYLIHCSYYLYFCQRHHFSSVTKNLQKKFFVGSCIQLIVAVIFVVLPTSIIVLIVQIKYIFYYYWFNDVVNICCLITPCFGTASSIVAIHSYRPYRNYCLKMFGRNGKVSNISNRQTTSAH